MITIRQMRYFDALARMRHFGRAARECSVSQPALSVQIQELEGQLGLVLVERRRDGVILTADGEDVLDQVRRALAEISGIEGYASGRKGISGRLRVGAIPTVAPYLLPYLLQALADLFPDARPSIRETRTANLLEELGEGRLDAVIAALPLEHDGIDYIELFRDRLLLASPLDRPGPDRRDPRAFIESSQLLLLEEGHCLRDQVLSHCGSQAIRHGEFYGTSNIATLTQMVANGLGITLVPEICVGAEVDTGRVRLTRFAEPQPFRTIALAWRAGSHHAQHYRAMAQALKPYAPGPAA